MTNIKRIEISKAIELNIKYPPFETASRIIPIETLPQEFLGKMPIDGAYYRHDWTIAPHHSLWGMCSRVDSKHDAEDVAKHRAKLRGVRAYLVIIVFRQKLFLWYDDGDFRSIEPCPPDNELKAARLIRHRLTDRDRRWVDHWTNEKQRGKIDRLRKLSKSRRKGGPLPRDIIYLA